MRRRVIGLRILANFIFDTVFLSLLASGFCVVGAKRNPELIVFLACAVCMIFSYVSRLYSPNYLIVAIVHLVLVFAVLKIPISSWEKFIIILALINETSRSFVFMKNNSRPVADSEVPWPEFLVCLIIFCFGLYMKNSFLQRETYIAVLIMLILHLLMHYLDGLFGYIEATKDVYGLPIRSIVGINSYIVTGIIIIIALCTLVGDWFNIEEVFIMAVDFIKKLGALIVQLFALFWIFVSRFISDDNVGHSEYEEQVKKVGYAADNTFESAFLFIVYAAVITLISYTCIKLTVFTIKKLMVKRAVSYDKKEKIVLKRQSEERVKIKKKDVKKGSPYERARRYYRQKIERYRYDITLNGQKSCMDIKNEIAKKELSDVDDITDLYMQIRYGGREVDSKTLKQMKYYYKQ